MTCYCIQCGKPQRYNINQFTCKCGGLLDIEQDVINFNNDANKQWAIPRYHSALTHTKEQLYDLSLGEGLTAIVPYDNSKPNLMLKLEYAMPTGSFKDRGALLVVAAAKSAGAKKIVQDSSGNAGAAIAAYAARAGIKCDIYLPANTAENKITQIATYGANVIKVKGSREDTARATLSAAHQPNVYYASHVYNPHFYEGTKTYVFEIFEQLGYLPDIFVTPVGNGTLLLGIYKGFEVLKNSGYIEAFPKIITVQAERCAPIHHAFHQLKTDASFSTTLAEGIAIATPKRIQQIIKAIKNTNGTVITAPEDEIIVAKKSLAQKGFYVEPTTAATFAAYFKHGKAFVKANQSVIIPLCGSGLKK